VQMNGKYIKTNEQNMKIRDSLNNEDVILHFCRLVAVRFPGC
jgi:hypothetical protein